MRPRKLRFVVETALVSQFRFYLALSSLKESGFVRESRHLEGMLLILTPEGRQSMELFASRIRASQQEKLEKNSAAWRRRVRDELSMPADFVPSGNGYAVTLRALESGEEIFSMTLTAATKVQAKRFCQRWPEKASYLYQTIMAQLGELPAQDAAQKPAAEQAEQKQQ